MNNATTLITLRYRFEWLQVIEPRFDAATRQRIRSERHRLLRQICRIQRELAAQGEALPTPLSLEEELQREARVHHLAR